MIFVRFVLNLGGMEASWGRKALFLSGVTILYNVLEGVVSLYFGVGDESVALAGFGVDSFIEVASAVWVMVRFRKENQGLRSLEAERKATFEIGILFVLLAVVTVGASGYRLWTGARPETTLAGAIIASLSLIFMTWLWTSKKKVAARLNSATVAQDASCSLACIRLSLILLAGSLLYWVFPLLWWADGVAALGLAVLIGKEGIETIRATRQTDFQGGCGCGHC